MKTSLILKTLTATGLLAATLTLSACDMHISFGQEDTRQGQEQVQEHGQEQEQNSENAGAPAAEESAPAGQDSTPGSDSGTSSSSTTENDGYSGPRIGENGVELDYDGNGKIPADVLEDDIVNAYAKQGTTVDDVDCYSDLRIYDRRGSQSCTVTAVGKKHYGTVKITSASQSGISYSLEFPHF
ncbi:hypothetical protein [Brevibacterium atlanticum]|uniref:hypothetical protein n=1 Tax=Brevibacterium atlanticum TaxID=2697563 RepID=UPI0014211CF9|nr:hypothetical protein [Brevibacterium atlanticum]